MEHMRLRVQEVGEGWAMVLAVSRRRVGGGPEAVITVELRVPPGATRRPDNLP
jgi:hypothetical protein